jgi:predicted RecA/RadA family phage recombinase
MADNRKFENGRKMSVTCSHPAAPSSGQPVRYGELTGVALTDERTAGDTTVDFGPGVYNLSVKGVNDGGNSAVAEGDKLFYVDADINDGSGFLSKKTSGRFFGFALAAVNAGATATIAVLANPAPGPSDLPAQSIDGADADNVANANIIGGIPVLHRVNIADGAGDTDVVLTHKTRVVEVWAVKTAANGGAGDTVTVKNGATAITDAMSLNINDKLIVRAASIDDAQHEIAAAGTLRVTAANVTNNACTVYVLGVRVA